MRIFTIQTADYSFRAFHSGVSMLVRHRDGQTIVFDPDGRGEDAAIEASAYSLHDMFADWANEQFQKKESPIPIRGEARWNMRSRSGATNPVILRWSIWTRT